MQIAAIDFARNVLNLSNANSEEFEDTENNEIVFVSEDGYIRTYFKPTDGINYYNRQ